MRRGVTQWLSRGIAHLKEGGMLEEYMRQVDTRRMSAAEQEELRSLLETSASLFQLQAAIPAPRAQATNRARFLGEAVRLRESSQAREAVVRAPVQPWRALLRVALALAVVLVVGSGMAHTAAASLPGSPLYPLKLVAEDTRLTLTFNPAIRAQLYLRFADERAGELVHLAREGRPANQAVVTRMAQQLQGAVLSAQAAGGELGLALLKQVIVSTDVQQQQLRQASTTAPAEAQPVLDAAVTVALQASNQARQALEILPMPTPSSVPTSTPAATNTLLLTPTPTFSQPPIVVVPPDTVTPSAAYTATPTGSPTDTPGPGLTRSATLTSTATDTPSRVPTLWAPTATLTSSVSPSRTLTPSRTATLTASPTQTPSPTATATQTATETRPPAPTNTPSATATQTPLISFSLSIVDKPDPVPATYRIYYDILLVNSGQVPLTNVTVVARWSPAECVYLPPNNPSQITWNIGRLNASPDAPWYWTKQLILSTFSICAWRTVRTEVLMTCDQGSARAVATTLIGPTPTPTATTTPTVTATMTETPTPTVTETPTATLTPILTVPDAH